MITMVRICVHCRLVHVTTVVAPGDSFGPAVCGVCSYAIVSALAARS